MKTQNLIKRNLLLLVLFLFSLNSFSQTVFADEKESYDGVKKIVVEGKFCDVTLKGENREDVKFEGVIKGISRKGNSYKINHRLEGSTLRVWIESPRTTWGNIDGSLKFLVPSQMELDVENSSGDVYCENISSDYTKISASSGDVNVKMLRSDLDVLTSSGEITLYEIEGDLTAKSSSGNQEYNKVTGNVNCIATSGDLELENVIGAISSRTSSGNQEFDTVEGQIKSISSSGNVEILNSKIILNLTSSSGNLRGQGLVLLGDSYFKATSGDISMMLLNDFEQLSFDLSASSGSLRAGNRKGDDNLYLKSGEIWVHGKTSSGNQTFK
ncbi:MAG: DUF4097 family beta strand repeat-containing protein [Labilibaculum antarcticum]